MEETHFVWNKENVKRRATLQCARERSATEIINEGKQNERSERPKRSSYKKMSKTGKQSSSCSHLFTNLAPYLTPTAPPTRRMKRSACRKSPQNGTQVTQRGTCLRQVAGPHSKKKEEELARLLRRTFFWHRVVWAHRQQHQTSTHLDQQELIHRRRSKTTIYTLSNKQKTSQQHYNIGKKERK